MKLYVKKIKFHFEDNIKHCVHDVIATWLTELDHEKDEKIKNVIKQKVIELEQVINRTGKPDIHFMNTKIVYVDAPKCTCTLDADAQPTIEESLAWWHHLTNSQQLTMITAKHLNYATHSELTKYALLRRYNRNPQKLFVKWLEDHATFNLQHSFI